MFGLIRAWKRRRLAKRPFPQEWLPYIEQHVGFYEFLHDELRQRFLDLLKVFVWEKHFFGAGGMEISERVKVVLAAAAVRLVLYLDLSYYDRLTEIIVYPSHYRHPDDDEGVIFGEARSWGTVVVSWEAILHGLENHSDGHDTATHEFAHVLDRGSGDFNGTPILRSFAQYRPWAEVMTHHYNRLKGGARPEHRVLRRYGATNEAEFFAVATESFFERPERMHEHTPELYELLKDFYGCDPLQRRRDAAARKKGAG
jgi:Mlc titration factor MtfA (ptsG expression regulator)